MSKPIIQSIPQISLPWAFGIWRSHLTDILLVAFPQKIKSIRRIPEKNLFPPIKLLKK